MGEKWRVPGDKTLFRGAEKKKQQQQQKTLKKSDPWIQIDFFGVEMHENKPNCSQISHPWIKIKPNLS
jgi:hypothetical protein